MRTTSRWRAQAYRPHTPFPPDLAGSYQTTPRNPNRKPQRGQQFDRPSTAPGYQRSPPASTPQPGDRGTGSPASVAHTECHVSVASKTAGGSPDRRARAPTRGTDRRQEPTPPPNPWLLVTERLLGPARLPLAPSEAHLHQYALPAPGAAYHDPLSAALDDVENPFASSAPAADEPSAEAISIVPVAGLDPHSRNMVSQIEATSSLTSLESLLPHPTSTSGHPALPGLPPPPAFLLRLSTAPPTLHSPSSPFTGEHAPAVIAAALLRTADLCDASPGLSHPEAATHISKQLLALANSLPTASLGTPPAATLLYALGRLQRYDEVLLNTLLSQLEPRLHTLSPQQFTHLLDGLALLKHPTPKPFLSAFLAASQPHLPALPAPQLTRLVWALGSLRASGLIVLGPSCDAWLAAAAAALSEHSARMSTGHLVDVAWAAAAVRRPTAVALAASIVEPVLDQLTSLTAHDLARLLQSLGAVQFRPEAPLLNGFLVQVKRMLPSLEQDTLPDALKGLALLGACPDRPWVDDVMLRSHTVMRHMKGGQLATAVWAFSRFKRAPYKQWTFDFFACCRNESAGMAAEDIVALVEGISQLKMKPNDETIHHLVAAMRWALPMLTKDQLVALAAGWRRLFRTLPGRPLRELVIEMERRASVQL